MAHLYLETTSDLPENADIPDILEALCLELVTRHQVDSAKVRACHTLRSVWHVGAGARPSYVHLSVFIPQGRDAGWKVNAANTLIDVLRERFQMSLESEEAAITVDMREMSPETYFHFP